MWILKRLIPRFGGARKIIPALLDKERGCFPAGTLARIIRVFDRRRVVIATTRVPPEIHLTLDLPTARITAPALLPRTGITGLARDIRGTAGCRVIGDLQLWFIAPILRTDIGNNIIENEPWPACPHKNEVVQIQGKRARASSENKRVIVELLLPASDRAGLLTVAGDCGVIKGAMPDNRARVIIEIKSLQELVLEGAVFNVGVFVTVGICTA